ncbi:MAG: prepilin-type N-terminal cleavage/methylation domain-containing protein [Acidobacteriota bacterium]
MHITLSSHRRAQRRKARNRKAQYRRPVAGFSLLEVVVTLGIVAVVLIAALSLVDSGGTVTRSQTAISDLQNNQRVAQQEMTRMLEMTGLGGVPEGIDPDLAGNINGGVFPNGLAIAVTNNVPPDTRIGSDLTTPGVVEGSDVLTVRGVLSTPVYFIEPQQTLTLDGNGMASVTIQQNPEIGVTQDLETLRQVLGAALAATPQRPEAFIVRDRFNPGAFAVMELNPAGTALGAQGDPSLTIGLILSSNESNQQYANEYGRMNLGTTLLQGSGGTQVILPDGTSVQLPRMIGSIGLLEEYRFYIREAWSIAGDSTSLPRPALSRARFYPGSDDLHPDGSIDVSTGVLDLQVALGVDLPPVDGRVADGFDAAGQAVGRDEDEVLYNHPDDDDGLSPAPGSRTWAALGAQVLFARLSTVVQAESPDRTFAGRDLGSIEDHDLSDSVFNSGALSKVRKRHLQTIVKLRNLS